MRVRARAPKRLMTAALLRTLAMMMLAARTLTARLRGGSVVPLLIMNAALVAV